MRNYRSKGCASVRTNGESWSAVRIHPTRCLACKYHKHPYLSLQRTNDSLSVMRQRVENMAAHLHHNNSMATCCPIPDCRDRPAPLVARVRSVICRHRWTGYKSAREPLPYLRPTELQLGETLRARKTILQRNRLHKHVEYERPSATQPDNGRSRRSYSAEPAHESNCHDGCHNSHHRYRIRFV